jgi:hypothetical protein
MSSFVCGLDIRKDSVYATMMSYGEEPVKKRRLIAEFRIKTDPVDSRSVSELTRVCALQLSYMPSDNIKALQQRTRRCIITGHLAHL